MSPEVLSESTVRDLTVLTDALWQAQDERAPIDPLTDTLAALSLEEAYWIQSRNVERRVTAGTVVRGRKVGLTSRRTNSCSACTSRRSVC